MTVIYLIPYSFGQFHSRKTILSLDIVTCFLNFQENTSRPRYQKDDFESQAVFFFFIDNTHIPSEEFASSMSPYAFILLHFLTLEPSPKLVKPLSPPRVYPHQA